MQILDSRGAVDGITEQFSTGDILDELLQRHTFLDYVASSEFATLIVNELAENVIEHADPRGLSTPAAALSVATVTFGDTTDPQSRFARRLEYGPAYEQSFIRDIQRAPGYLELCVSDAGVGIPATLRQREDLFGSWFGREMDVSDADLLKAAFRPDVTRDPGVHRPGLRGLYYVRECVREYHGLLVCETGKLRTEFARDGFDVANAKVTPLSHEVTGTHLRILLPLQRSAATARPWRSMTFSRSEALHAQDEMRPPISSLPSAPLPAASKEVRLAQVALFGSDCDAAVSAKTDSTIWLSAGRARRWRKQHIQLFLDSVVHHSQGLAVILNVPATLCEPLRFIARHFLKSTRNHVLLVIDDSGRRTLVSSDASATIVDEFHDWSRSNRGLLNMDFSREAGMLSAFAASFRTLYEDISLDNLTVGMCVRGFAADFDQFVGNHRIDDPPVALDRGLTLRGFVSVYELIADATYARALGAQLNLLLTRVLAVDVVFAIGQAAATLLEEQAIPYWHADRADSGIDGRWFAAQKVAVLTDVVASGNAAGKHVAAIRRAARGAGVEAEIWLLAPLLAQVQSERVKSGGSHVAEVMDDDDVPTQLLWWQQITPTKVTDSADAVVPERRTNLLLNPNVAPEKVSYVIRRPAVLFIRDAERQDAVWCGHVEITGTHFDVEFDMTRLLAPRSRVGRAIVRDIVTSLRQNNTDTVMYPDASRIHIVVGGIDEAMSDEEGVQFVRIHKDARGGLFVSERDLTVVRSARRIMILDDAVNSGSTTRQMLNEITELARECKSIVGYAVISREGADERNFRHAVTSVGAASVEWIDYTHIPVKFFSREDCPMCRYRKFAQDAAIYAPTRLRVRLQHLSNAMQTATYGRGERGKPKPGARVPVDADRREAFVSQSGAQAAVALAAERSFRERTANWRRLLMLPNNTKDAEIGTFALYAVTTRAPRNHPVWSSDELLGAVVRVCSLIAVDGAPAVEATLQQLTASIMVTPRPFLARIVATVLRELIPRLDLDIVYEHLLLLGLLGGRNEVGKDGLKLLGNELDVQAVSVRLQRELVAEPKRRGDILMRLRHVRQVTLREPFELPWLDGLHELLAILAYKNPEHHRIEILHREAMMFVEAMVTQGQRAVEDSAWAVEFRRRAEIVARIPTQPLQIVADTLFGTLRAWFRAIHYSNVLKWTMSFKDVMGEIEQAQASMARLLEAVTGTREALGSYSIERVVSAIEHLHKAQGEALARVLASTAVPRQVVEQKLTALYDPCEFLTRAAVRLAYDGVEEPELTGSWFDYADAVAAGMKPSWVVVLGPSDMLRDILVNVLITNPKEHDGARLPRKRIEVNATLEGVETHGATIRIGVSVLLGGERVAVTPAWLSKTLGARRAELALYGGDLYPASIGGGVDDVLVVELATGYF
jgi:hypothetical protein